MLEACLFPPALGLQVTTLDAYPAALLIHLATTTPTAPCPLCHQTATRVHSRYQRTLADLPCVDYALQLDLHVRRFFCDTPPCPRRIFAERLPDLVQPWAQRTTRAAATLRHTGLALGGEAGARLLVQLHLPTSPDTLLRLVRQLATTAPRPTPRVLGVDDWALRKGQTYGTLLIDLETGEPVDLLADREADTLAAWLAAHPGVEIISRDRAGAYADGARRGAPQAQQVADRFHILKNLGDALDKLLIRIAPTLTASAVSVPVDAAPPACPAPVAPLREQLPEAGIAGGPEMGIHPTGPGSYPTPEPAGNAAGDVAGAAVPPAPTVTRRGRQREEQRRQTRRTRQLARYEDVQRLHQAGWNDSAIARELGLDRATVRKWVQSPQFPEPQLRAPRARQIDAYSTYVAQRWQAGCHNARQLWHELRARGYRGGYSQVAAYLAEVRLAHGIPLRAPNGGAPTTPPPPAVPRARQLRWLLWRPVADWSDEEYDEYGKLDCPVWW